MDSLRVAIGKGVVMVSTGMKAARGTYSDGRSIRPHSTTVPRPPLNDAPWRGPLSVV